jgi:hypothetical protein
VKQDSWLMQDFYQWIGDDMTIMLAISEKMDYTIISIPAAPLFNTRNSAGFFYSGGAFGIY